MCKRIEKSSKIIEKQPTNNSEFFSLHKANESFNNKEFNPIPITVQRTRTKSINIEDKYYLGTTPSMTAQSTKHYSRDMQSFEGLNSTQKSYKSPEKKEKLVIRNVEIKPNKHSSPTSYNIHCRTQSQPTIANSIGKLSSTMMENFDRSRSPSNITSQSNSYHY